MRGRRGEERGRWGREDSLRAVVAGPSLTCSLWGGDTLEESTPHTQKTHTLWEEGTEPGGEGTGRTGQPESAL